MTTLTQCKNCGYVPVRITKSFTETDNTLVKCNNRNCKSYKTLFIISKNLKYPEYDWNVTQSAK